jgi:hypothetical protein
MYQIESKESWQRKLNANGMQHFKIRDKYIKEVGFPIYTTELIDELVIILSKHKVVEVGCGTGFLSYTLQNNCVDITAIDDLSGRYCHEDFVWPRYTNIINADATEYDLSPFDAVIMSWPDYESPFACKIAQKLTHNQFLIYQGEGEGGCTGDDDFFHLVNNEFRRIEHSLNEATIQFHGIHDNWVIYQRD